MTNPQLGYYVAPDLMRMEFPPPRFAVPGLIAEGFNVLAGKPKTRKSWMLLGLGIAVSSGGRALGHLPVAEGDVLYCALEDTPRRLQSRMRLLLGSERPSARLHLATEWPRADQGGVEQIRDWLTNYPDARLVMIDTLAKFRPLNGREGYSADYAAIEPLQKLAGGRAVAIVAATHLRKAVSEDWLDSVNATLGLVGAADATLGLFTERGKLDAVLKVVGRDVDEQEMGVRFDSLTASWQLLGSAEEVTLSRERRDVLELLEQGPSTPRLAAGPLGKTEAATKKLLWQMSRDGQLLVERGVYSIPPKDPVTRVTEVTEGRGATEVTVYTTTTTTTNGELESGAPPPAELAEPAGEIEEYPPGGSGKDGYRNPSNPGNPVTQRTAPTQNDAVLGYQGGQSQSNPVTQADTPPPRKRGGCPRCGTKAYKLRADLGAGWRECHSCHLAFNPGLHCAGCGQVEGAVSIAVWNDRGRWCTDCESKGLPYVD